MRRIVEAAVSSDLQTVKERQSPERIQPLLGFVGLRHPVRRRTRIYDMKQLDGRFRRPGDFCGLAQFGAGWVMQVANRDEDASNAGGHSIGPMTLISVDCRIRVTDA